LVLKENKKFNNILKKVYFGKDFIKKVKKILKKKQTKKEQNVFFVDSYFKRNNLLCDIFKQGNTYYIDTKDEPSTNQVDKLVKYLKKKKLKIKVIVGIGGGSVLDIAKSVSNLLTNSGSAENYQGWNLVKKRGVYKIGIPTISGTGSETTQTAVLLNKKKSLKLGINSKFSVFDEILLDPNLSKTVKKNQFFYTAMDTYIHCIESLSGNYRNTISDKASFRALKYFESAMNSKVLNSKLTREKFMLSSYFGGLAISKSYVGLIHPLSAALSVVYGYHHCIANCIVMRAMSEFYPKEYIYFWKMVRKHKINIPKNVCKKLKKNIFRLVKSTLVHSKPLKNALGNSYEKILTKSKLEQIFRKM